MHLNQHSRSKADVLLRNAEAALIDILWASMKGWSLHTHRPETIIGSSVHCSVALLQRGELLVHVKALQRQDQAA